MKPELLKMLKIMQHTLSSLTERELEKLINGEGELVYSDKKFVEKVKAEKPQLTNPLIVQLKSVSNRAEATKLLSQQGILKKDLIEIARTCNVHINKSDKKAKLIEKVVESTIGASLRSKAIKETELRQSGIF